MYKERQEDKRTKIIFTKKNKKMQEDQTYLYPDAPTCWKNVITHTSVLESQPTLSKAVQIKILSVSLTRRKSP